MGEATSKINEILSSPTTSRLLTLLSDGSVFVRANALEALVKRIDDSPEIPKRIEDAICSKDGSVNLIGSVTLAYFGIAELLRSQNQTAHILGQRLWREYNKPDKDLLDSFLEREEALPHQLEAA